MSFHEYPAKPWTETLPRATEWERDLIGGLLRYESGERMTAKDVGILSTFEWYEGAVADPALGLETSLSPCNRG